jgi:riboflavin synthase
MFTGIIEKTLPILGIAEGPGFCRLTLTANWNDLRLGESVALNGCCLTIAEMSTEEIAFDVITETLAKTNLGLLKAGDRVHVERSLQVGQRLDGHFVQGHVDGTARLVEIINTSGECRLVIEPPDAMAKYIIPKGSVAMDGVSLTVAAIRGNIFEVALIPTTLKLTELANHSPGWPYNLETDILSKTVVSWLERQQA